MHIVKHYKQLLRSGDMHYDAAQEIMVGHLGRLYDALEDFDNQSKWMRYWNKVDSRGLYIWGGVGRGKTCLMDLFYKSIKDKGCIRIHFHRFMQVVHHGLQRYEGTRNPLQKVAEEISLEGRVLCFDDFFVIDIADAMLLAGLLKALFAKNMVILITSNIDPDDLYKDGLQRERFLPSIALLKKHSHVVRMANGTDYRLATLKNHRLYHCPANEKADSMMQEEFTLLSSENGSSGEILEVEGRELWTRRMADDVVWFNFNDLCDGPRSQNDYLHIALEFHTVFLSGLPQMDASMDALARRFIYLIDVLYDHRVQLVISAATPPPDLYCGQTLATTFERTISRLIEMQSEEYLIQCHRAK